MQTPRRADPTPTEPPAPSPFFRFRFADVEFDESVGILSVAGVPVDIEPRPRELLSELLRRPNEVVAREELLETLWQGRPTVDNVLANAVTKLRKALGQEGAERLINVPRVGYRLAGPIERVAVGQHAGELPLFVAGERVPGRETYRLEAPLGPGAATALVWRARDPKLQETRVFKFAADGERLTALKREYTLYRVLRAELGERDDFARVLGANFSTAPYFLECEDGGPDLPTWADEEGRLAALATAERLQLFLQIARAVAAAHGVGVLHKDLKPANVLVAASGDGWQAKLTDFGSSRLLDPARLAALGVTAMGLTVTHGIGSDSPGGTPLYLAPELIAGRSPTTQSDLYALGLMLYQMVVGDLRRPMSTGWQREIDDPLLAEDIAAATEGRPEDRLGSVAELVERLERLEARRVAAVKVAEAARRAEGLLAEADRRRARRPWVVGALIALSLGFATSLWFYRQARLSLVEATRATERAESINDFLTEDVLEASDPSRLDSAQPATMAEVLRRASASAAERFRGKPLIEASVRLQLGGVFQRLEDRAASEAEYRRAIALLSTALPAADPQLLSAHLQLIEVLALESHLDEAQTLLEADEKVLTPEMLARNPRLELQHASARRYYLGMRQRYAESLSSFVRAVELTDLLYPGDDSKSLQQRFTARSKLADAHWRLNHFEEAAALYDAILRHPYSAAVVGEVHFARARIDRARLFASMGKTEGVEAELIEARDLLIRRSGPLDAYAARANFQLGDLYLNRSDFSKASDAFAAAQKGFLASLGPRHPNPRIAALNLAIIEVDTGNAAAGLPGLELGRPQFVVDAGGTQNAVVQAIDFYRATALNDLKRGREAAAILATLQTALLAESDPRLDWEWRLQAEKARASIATGNGSEGRTLLRSALQQMIALKSPEWLLAKYRRLLEPAVSK